MPSKRRKRQVGGSRVLAFRPTPEIQSYIDTQEARGFERTGVILELLEEAVSLRESLGLEYFDFMKLSAESGKPVGDEVATAAKQTLKNWKKT